MKKKSPRWAAAASTAAYAQDITPTVHRAAPVAAGTVSSFCIRRAGSLPAVRRRKNWKSAPNALTIPA